MAEIMGTVTSIKRYLSPEKIELKISPDMGGESTITLQQNRKYIIPDFQREIRWEENNLSILLSDLSTSARFLGNIILTIEKNGDCKIIDGQQRTTVLLLILAYIKNRYQDQLEPFVPCSIENRSFLGLSKLMEKGFDSALLNDPKVIETDYYGQRQSFTDLWKWLEKEELFSTAHTAKTILENIEKSQVNIIASHEDESNSSIRYFLDVNLKGVQLDTEDIFKAQIFSLSLSPEMLQLWRENKAAMLLFNHTRAKGETDNKGKERYFDLYFSYSSNDYLRLHADVIKFVKAVFNQHDYTAMTDLVSCTLTQVTSDNQKEWFEQLENKLSNFPTVPYSLAKSLYNQIYNVDDTHYFFGLSARQRCTIIITDILCLCEDTDFSDFLLTAKDYGKLEILNVLIYWLDNKKESNMELASIRKQQLEQTYQSLCATILNDQIDLYSDKYYHPLNIHGLYGYCGEAKASIFKSYVRSIASSKNIYRILWDVTSHSIGEEYNYSLSSKDLALFFDDETIVDRLLKGTFPKNESEEFIMSIYSAFKSGNQDYLGRKGITTAKDIKPIL